MPTAKRITMYACDICGERYPDTCEAQGCEHSHTVNTCPHCGTVFPTADDRKKHVETCPAARGCGSCAHQDTNGYVTMACPHRYATDRCGVRVEHKPVTECLDWRVATDLWWCLPQKSRCQIPAEARPY